MYCQHRGIIIFGPPGTTYSRGNGEKYCSPKNYQILDSNNNIQNRVDLKNVLNYNLIDLKECKTKGQERLLPTRSTKEGNYCVVKLPNIFKHITNTNFSNRIHI